MGGIYAQQRSTNWLLSPTCGNSRIRIPALETQWVHAQPAKYAQQWHFPEPLAKVWCVDTTSEKRPWWILWILPWAHWERTRTQKAGVAYCHENGTRSQAHFCLQQSVGFLFAVKFFLMFTMKKLWWNCISHSWSLLLIMAIWSRYLWLCHAGYCTRSVLLPV